MSVKSTVNQITSDKTFAAATAPTPPIITSYSVNGIDDTALDPAGGQTVIIRGSNFNPGVTVNIGATSIGVVSYVDPNTLSFTSPALSAGTYTLYVINTDNGTGILTPGIIYSTFPTWVTSAGSQGSYYETQSINNSFVATSDTSITSYTLYSGTLPTGSSLSTSGVLTGTAPVDSGSTTYTFTIQATDSELQDSTRSFSLTINTDVVTWVSPADGATYNLTGNQAMSNVTLSATDAAGYNVSYSANALPTGVTLSGNTISGTPTVAASTTTLLTATAATTNRYATRTVTWVVTLGDLYWKNVSLLLNGTTPTPSFINDASLNNAQLTIAGDTKPNLFTPYEDGYYSNYFDGTGDYLTITSNLTNISFSTGDFTVECWMYFTSVATDCGILGSGTGGYDFVWRTSTGLNIGRINTAFDNTFAWTPNINQWYHIAYSRSGTSLKVFVNGTQVGTTATNSIAYNAASNAVIGASTSTPDRPMNGYISNLRLLKGTALYTTNFTPSTSPLTAVSGTSLLTCQSPRLIDNSINNFAITKNGDTSVRPAIPFVTPTTSSYNTQYSTYFDGSGDYLSAPASTAFAFGTGDYTLEFWVYSIIAYSGVICLYNNNSGGYFLQYNTGTGLQTGVAGSSATGTYATTLTANTWNHIAVSRASGSSKCFVNGTQVGTTLTDNTNYAQNGAYIGALYNGDQPFNGHISNLRVVKGTALYTTNFTPSTTPLTAVSGTSLLTCQNSTLIDNSTNAFAITSYNQASPIAVSPFTMTTSTNTLTSLGSTYFDGTGDYLSVPSNPGLNLGSSDFTMEGWFNWSGGTTNWTLFYKASSYELKSDASRWVWQTIGISNVFVTGWTPTVGVWYHIALVRKSTVTTLYINGVAFTSGTSSNPTDSANALQIGSGSATFNGYTSDVRVVKGTALYTANFLPPQAPLTPVTNTQLLTCQYNGGANNNSFVDQSSFNNLITRAGNTTQGTFSPYSPTGWSNYFNGSTDSFTTATLPAIALNTNYTIEMWVYPTILTNTTNYWLAMYNNTGGSGSWGLTLIGQTGGATAKVSLWMANFSSAKKTTTLTVPLGSWSHIAVVRNSGVNTIYVNGIADSSPYSSSIAIPTNTVSVGYYSPSSNGYYNGYISNFRIVNGTAVYTSNFTPSTTPLAAVTGTNLLTCQSNRFIDNSSGSYALTVAGTPSTQAYSPFGGVTSVPASYSVYLDGTSDSYTITGTAGPVSTEDFTWECWSYISAMGGQYPRIFENTTSGGFQVYLDSGTLIVGGNGTGTITSYSISALTNQWVHLCVTRSGSALRLFVNGVLRGYSGSGGNNFAAGTTWRTLTEGSGIVGYLSNMRVVRGSVVSAYSTSSTTTGTTVFTPPTSPLSAISGTSFLGMQSPTLVDNSPNYFAITAAGNTQPYAYNPFGTTNTTGVSYTPSVNGGSMYFDGSGDYLTTGTFAPGTNNFTVDFWFYCTALPASGQQGMFLATPWGGSNFQTYISSDSTIIWQAYTQNNTNVAVKLNQWYHVAVVKNGSTGYFYINGVLQNTATLTNSISGTATVGAREGGLFFTGYISDMRTSIGSVLYTANFYPGPAPATPTTTIGATTYASNLLVNGTSGGIIDYHGTNDLETVGTTQLAPQDPYSGAYYSNYSDGNGDYLTVPSASWSTLAGTFTVEYWIRWNVAPATAGTIAGVYTNGGLTFYNDGTRISPNIYGSGNIFNSTFLTASVVLGKWYHFAITRNSSNLMTMWVDGVSVGSTTTATTYTQGTWYIFSFNNTNLIQGNISNFRVNNTCLYTTSFTPSTTPLTAVAGTQLLTCQSNRFKDNSTNAATLTPAGTVAVQSSNPFRQNTGKSLYFGTKTDTYAMRSIPSIANLPGDFTIECWVNPTDTSISTTWGILDARAAGASASAWLICLSSYSSGWVMNMYTGTSYSGTTRVQANQWTYLAWVRSGSTLTFYVNGVAGGTATVSGAITGGTTTVVVGSKDNGLTGYGTVGYINDLRITNGTARYTTTFTPPTTPDQTN